MLSWIKVDTTVVNKPKVVKIVRSLKLKREEALGYLVKFWCLIDGLTEDGALPGYDAEEVDNLVGAQGFGKALADVGWLTFDEEGCTVYGFEQHNGSSAKKRAMKASSIARVRANTPPNQECRTNGPTNVEQNVLPREEKRKEENRREERETLSPIDADASTLSLDSFDSSPSKAPITIEEAVKVGEAKQWASIAVKKWWNYNDARNWKDVVNWQSSLELWMLRERPDPVSKAAEAQANYDVPNIPTAFA